MNNERRIANGGTGKRRAGNGPYYNPVAPPRQHIQKAVGATRTRSGGVVAMVDCRLWRTAA